MMCQQRTTANLTEDMEKSMQPI